MQHLDSKTKDTRIIIKQPGAASEYVTLEEAGRRLREETFPDCTEFRLAAYPNSIAYMTGLGITQIQVHQRLVDDVNMVTQGYDDLFKIKEVHQYGTLWKMNAPKPIKLTNKQKPRAQAEDEQ